MADTNDPSDPKKPADTETTPPRRPFATLDLKATEIKVTSIAERNAGSDANREQGAAGGAPGPMPRRDAGAQTSTGTARAAASNPASQSHAQSGANTAEKNSTRTEAMARTEPVVVIKRGGFLSHVFAGLIGGAFVLTAPQWWPKDLRWLPIATPSADNLSPLEKRLEVLEQRAPEKLSEERLSELEKIAKTIPALADGQTRFIAETKATLADAEGAAGSTDLIERLGKLEVQLKTLAETNGKSSSADRSELTAVTSKVSELEAGVAAQIAALRKSIAGDIEVRLQSARDEATKSGSEQLDKTVADIKAETANLRETGKAQSTELNERLKRTQDETASVKTALDAIKATSVKPADVEAAVGPLAGKIAALDNSLQAVLKAEADRRENAERVLISLELQNLKRALDRGQSYGAEFQNVEKAAGGKVDLTALAKFKDEGLPAVADLTRDFRSTANAAINADRAPPTGGVVDRLLEGAKNVIQVRRIDHGPDDKSAEAVVGRMEVALKESRLADVLSEAKDLSPKAQDAVKPFLDRVAARASVETALSRIETELKASLGDTPTQSKTTP